LKGMRILTLTALVLVTAAIAFAAEHGGGEHHGLNWMDFLFRIINFIIFIAIIYKFAGKGIAGFFRGRREQIETQLNDFSARREEAEKRLRGVEQSIANIEKERAQILADFRSQGEALKASIIAKAHEAAEKIKAQAEMTAAQERKAAQEKIRAEMAEMIVEAAEKILAEKLTADDHEKLISEYLTKVVLN